MSLFFYLFTFAINLWHRKFVTADVTAVLVFSDEDKILIKTHKYTQDRQFAFSSIFAEYLQNKDRQFAFFSIFAEYLQKIEFLISQDGVATCLSGAG